MLHAMPRHRIVWHFPASEAVVRLAWVAGHLVVAGPGSIRAAVRSDSLRRLTPEVSLKLG